MGEEQELGHDALYVDTSCSPDGPRLKFANNHIWNPNLLIVSTDNGVLVDINMETGTVTFGDNYTLDEATEQFWTAMAHKSPAALEARIKVLEQQLEEAKEQAAM